jgi:hypothetical protein
MPIRDVMTSPSKRGETGMVTDRDIVTRVSRGDLTQAETHRAGEALAGISKTLHR